MSGYKMTTKFIGNFIKKLSLSIILMMLLFVLCLWGLYIIADMIFEDKNLLFDQKVFVLLNPYVSNINTAIMQVITFLGSQNFLLPANIILIGYCVFFKANKKTAVNIAAVSITSVVVMFSIKIYLQRERPLIPLISKVNGYSFPSGHTFSSVTFYGIIAYIIYKNVHIPLLKWSLIIFLILFIFLIGLSRVYLRLHYASDVMASFCLGIIWLLAAKWFLQKSEKNNPLK